MIRLLPYDQFGRNQYHGMSAFNSDHRDVISGSAEGAAGFRAYHRPPSSYLSTDFGSRDLVSAYYRHRQQELGESAPEDYSVVRRSSLSPSINSIQPYVAMEPFIGYHGNETAAPFHQLRYSQQSQTSRIANYSVQAPLRSPFDTHRQTGDDVTPHHMMTSLSSSSAGPPFRPNADVSVSGQSSNTSLFDMYYNNGVITDSFQSSTVPPSTTSTNGVSPDSGTYESGKSTTSSGRLTIDDNEMASPCASACETTKVGSSRAGGDRFQTSSRRQRISRKTAVAVPDERKDSVYYERRKKNNESARRSRESRHYKEQTTLDECQTHGERITKLRIQLELMQREYNEMCKLVYARIGPTAAARIIVPPPPPPPPSSSLHYGFVSGQSTTSSMSGLSLENEQSPAH